MTYPVVFTQTKDEKDTVLVYVPDLDRATEGYGIDDAIVMARDLIGSFLVDEPSGNFPAPSEIDSIDAAKSEFADAGKSFVSLVDVDIDYLCKKLKSKKVRRNITLPEWLNAKAERMGINFSKTLAEALIQKCSITATA